MQDKIFFQIDNPSIRFKRKNDGSDDRIIIIIDLSTTLLLKIQLTTILFKENQSVSVLKWQQVNVL